jgi:hypothetical protein
MRFLSQHHDACPLSRNRIRWGQRTSILLQFLVVVNVVSIMVGQSHVNAYSIVPITTLHSMTSTMTSSSLFSRQRCRNYDKNTPTGMQHQLARQFRQSSSSSSTSHQIQMVNFGPYGDYLNSKVNDEDDNNKDNADQMTSNKNMNIHQSSGNTFVENKVQEMDYFYYYHSDSDSTTSNPISSSSSSTSSVGSSSNNNNNSNIRQQILPQQSLDKIDSDVAAGTFRLYEIYTSSMKPGGLRLFIIMYLLGNMVPFLWKVDRPSSDEYIIDLYFHDHSAILSIELIPSSNNHNSDIDRENNIDSNNDKSSESSTITSSSTSNIIHINRIGSSPSSTYKLHEATIIQGMIHEFISCAIDPIIPIPDRLITLSNTTIAALQDQCKTLPFG